VRDSLIEEAINDARDRADLAAGVLNMNVTGVQSVTIGDTQFPLFSSRAFEAAALSAATQFLPGQQEVSTTVHITFFIDEEDEDET
jgi:uncharacterized protein YggE